MDLQSMVQLGIDILQCDYLTRKSRADHNSHLRKLVDIPSFRFVHSFCIFRFPNIRHLMHIDCVASSGIRYDLLDYHSILANIDIH